MHNCHNFSSKIFSSIFFKLTSEYSIGLTATPQRSDGCEYVFKWHIGDIVYESPKIEREGLAPIIKTLLLNSKEYKEIKVENKYTNQEQIQYTSMLSDLLNMESRNKLLINILKTVIEGDNKRRILLLSERRTHLQMLKNLLDEDMSITFTYGLFIGSMKIKDLERSKSCTVILATYKAFSEGVSEKGLNTLILASPKKYIDNSVLKNENSKKDSGSLVQITGRIFRKIHTDIHPVIIDLQDNFSVFRAQLNSRNIFFKKFFSNSLFNKYTFDLDKNLNLNVCNFMYIDKNVVKHEETNDKEMKEIIYEECLLD